MVKEVSVNVLNYNGLNFLNNCIKSLLSQDHPSFEICVIDNHSSDNSLNLLKSKFKTQINSGKIKLIEHKENLGFAKAYDLAYSKNKSPYFLLLNNDVFIPKKNFLSKLLEFAKKKDADIVGGLEYGPKEKIKSYEKYRTLSILGFNSEEIPIKDQTFYVSGSCLLIKKSSTNSLFPHEYFCYGEDVFLCWKIQLCKGKVFVCKDVRYLHYGFGASGKRSSFTRYHAERNRLTNLILFYSFFSLIKIFPLFLLELFFKILYTSLYPKLLLQIFKAMFYNLKNINKILKQRKEIQLLRNVDDIELMKLMSYKIFPEHLSKMSVSLNKLSKFYCSIFKIKTIDS